MGKIIKVDENGGICFPFDYEKRLQNITKKLDDAIFNEFRDKLKEIREFNAECLAKFRKKEPTLNVILVSSTLNQTLRDVVPASLRDCMTLEPSEIQVAFNYFMRLMTSINELVVLVPDKTLFAAFMGITTSTYDALRQEDKYRDVFDGVDDYIQHQTLLGAKSGYTKESSSTSQLHIKGGIGHSLTNAHDIMELPEELPEFNYADFIERRRLAASVMQIGKKSSKKQK